MLLFWDKSPDIITKSLSHVSTAKTLFIILSFIIVITSGCHFLFKSELRQNVAAALEMNKNDSDFEFATFYK